MKMTKSLLVPALCALGLASACAADTEVSAPEDVSFGETAWCSNESGTDAAMATLAVAAAMELRRWQPRTDFWWNWWSNRLDLTWQGRARCADGVCRNVQAVLDWQDWAYHGKIRFLGGSTLDSGVFQSRLAARYNAQQVCDSRPNNQPGNCAVEEHELKFLRSELGSCDTNFFFHAYKPGTTTNISYPGNLKDQLMWVGWDPAGGNATNPYLAFDVEGDDVRIDPTAGAVGGDPAASGTCPAVCTKFSLMNVSGNCCVCNGVYGSLQHSVAPPRGSAYMFSCR